MSLIDIGTLCLFACFVLSLAFVARYAGRNTWHRSFAGIIAFVFGCVMVLAFGLSVLALSVPLSFPVRVWARIAIFGGSAVCLAAMNVGLHITRPGRRRDERDND